MTESAAPAMSFGCAIADRMSAWAKDHPDAEEYSITTENEAAELLVAIVAAAEMQLAGQKKNATYHEQMRYLAEMQQAATQGDALDYIRTLTMEQELQFVGLRIVVPLIVLQ